MLTQEEKVNLIYQVTKIKEDIKIKNKVINKYEEISKKIEEDLIISNLNKVIGSKMETEKKIEMK